MLRNKQMKRAIILINLPLLIMVLAFLLPAQADQRTVTITNPGIEKGMAATTLEIVDLGDSQPAAKSWSGNGRRFDFLRYRIKPASSCDDASDCADAIEDACDAVGQAVENVTFSMSNGTCDGECENGTLVTTVCVSP